ncbi:zinc finger protein 19-like [Uranotaenia lowii]|uniref:zinc finger protein 19-like n=1 Tax=Uranotaenia lowii TaxID=190385 RepID=UPI00247917E2|nr:zinc finger protein 19-like [Uranotaenia lowii]XP_055584726.1 zinc finger protein 19-like [Uranotaenia lowii]
MVKICAVLNCLSNRYSYEGIYMYPLPRKNPDLLLTWMRACRRPEGYVPPGYMFVCEKHFDESIVTRNSQDTRRKLIAGAVPTLNLDCELPPAFEKQSAPEKGRKTKKHLKVENDGIQKTSNRKTESFSKKSEGDDINETAEEAPLNVNTTKRKRREPKEIEEVLVDGGCRLAKSEFEEENLNRNVHAYCRLCCVKFEYGNNCSLDSLGDDETVSGLLNISLIESPALTSAQQICMICYDQFTNFVQFLKVCHRGQLNFMLQLSGEQAKLQENTTYELHPANESSAKLEEQFEEDTGLFKEESESDLSENTEQNEPEDTGLESELPTIDFESSDPTKTIEYIDQLITEMDQSKYKRQKHKPGRDYECTDCGEVFQRSHVHRAHRKHCSLVGSPLSLRNKRYDCTLCSRKSIQSISGYRYHLWNIHRGIIQPNGNNDHVPEELMKMYTRKSYPCSLCKDIFRSRNLLRYHLLTHKQILQGGSDFRKRCRDHPNSKIKTLEKIRTSEPKIVCSICGKQIATSALPLHMKFHLKQKDFKCKECGKLFYINSDLQIHIDRNHKKIRYSCDVCGASLATKKTLHVHKLLHNEAALIYCEICPERTKRFTNKDALRRHMNKQHNCIIGVEGTPQLAEMLAPLKAP